MALKFVFYPIFLNTTLFKLNIFLKVIQKNCIPEYSTVNVGADSCICTDVDETRLLLFCSIYIFW